jgi:hypothetical protein
LKPYADTVSGIAFQVANEQATTPRGQDEAIREVSRRTRATLKSYGVEIAAEKKSPVASRRIRPAGADMGGASGGPRADMSAKQKQIYALAGRR